MADGSNYPPLGDQSALAAFNPRQRTSMANRPRAAALAGAATCIAGGLAVAQPGEKLPPAQSLGVAQVGAQRIAGVGGLRSAFAEQRLHIAADGVIGGRLG